MYANSKFHRLSTHIIQELLLLMLERYRPRKQFSLRSGHLHVHTSQSLRTVYFSTLSNNLSNWRQEQFFFVPTLYKKTSIFCRRNKLTRSFVFHLHSFHERFLVLPCSLTQSTCGKSNQSVNLQTHAGLEGILSNYFSVSEEGFPVWTTLLLFALSTLCQSPSVNFDMSNLG